MVHVLLKHHKLIKLVIRDYLQPQLDLLNVPTYECVFDQLNKFQVEAHVKHATIAVEGQKLDLPLKLLKRDQVKRFVVKVTG